MNAKANPVSISYFDNLPRYLMPALQAAWDKVKTGQYGTKAIHNSFRKDCEQVGHEPPSIPVMNQWISGVQNVRIPRPLATADAKDEAEANAKAVTQAVDAEIQDAATGKVYRPGIIAAVDPETRMLTEFRPIATAADLIPSAEANADDAFEALIARMVEELARELKKDIKAQARRQVAERLRAKATALEGAAA